MSNNQEFKAPVLIEDLGMLYPMEKSKRKARYGLYVCSCGNEFKAQTSQVKSRHTSSCGCYNKIVITKHGLHLHPLYSIWNGINSRTSKVQNCRYKDYGGRGIELCERWKDINNFIDDMYPTYKQGLSIDRIDVNGNYEPSNCRWVDNFIQARNTRKIISTNTSGYRGVSFNKKLNKWQSQIYVNSKPIRLGLYQNKLDAAHAYDNYVIINNLEHTRNFT